jgi:xylan 1,4-beta-xylosidase
MFGLLGGERVDVTDSAVIETAGIVSEGVRGKPDIRAIATRSEHSVEILVWNYHDDDVPAKPAAINLTIDGLPKSAHHAFLQHFRIDANHSNAYAVWKAFASPQSPTPDQYKQLESAGRLQLLSSPRWIDDVRSAVRLDFELPRQGLSLVKISWSQRNGTRKSCSSQSPAE